MKARARIPAVLAAAALAGSLAMAGCGPAKSGDCCGESLQRPGSSTATASQQLPARA